MSDRHLRDRNAFDALLNASAKLEDSGVSVLAQVWNGTRPLIVVKAPPRFVRGVVRRRQMVGREMVYTCAAPYHGVQLEWVQRLPVSQAVGHA